VTRRAAWGLVVLLSACPGPADWTPAQRLVIASLELKDTAPPADPTNRVADDPAAAALGRRLFEDPAFSTSGTTACATCHDAAKGWGDDLPTAQGLTSGPRNTRSLLGAPWSAWLFWDGSRDSLWAQALAPVENPVEHGFTRTQVVRRLRSTYSVDYEAIFGALPDLDAAGVPARAMPVPADTGDPKHVAWTALDASTRTSIDTAFANFGKAIAAYERTIRLPRAPFDDYARAIGAGTDPGVFPLEAELGLALFLGKADCIACHSGPRFTDEAFHNLGLPTAASAPDRGRSIGAARVLADPFNCLGPHSDDASACNELRFLDARFPDFEGAFRTPTLRAVESTGPYMHDGRFGSLEAVLRFYSQLPDGTFAGHRERLLRSLELTDDEIRHLLAFLATLTPTAGP